MAYYASLTVFRPRTAAIVRGFCPVGTTCRDVAFIYLVAFIAVVAITHTSCNSNSNSSSSSIPSPEGHIQKHQCNTND